jgi:hypothetical protein
MIFNFLKHLFVALILDAGAGLAFGVDAAPAADTVAAPPQSCMVPAAVTGADLKTTEPDNGTQS